MQIDLLALLDVIYEREIELLDQQLISVLNNLNSIHRSIDDSSYPKDLVANQRPSPSVMTLSRVIESRLLGPEEMSFETFSKYMILHRVCQDILYASNGVTYRRISKLLGVKLAKKQWMSEAQRLTILRKLTIAHDLADPGIDTNKLIDALPSRERGTALIGYLSGRNSFEQIAKDRRVCLAEFFSTSTEYELVGPAIPNLSLPYMYVSYWAQSEIEAAVKRRVALFLNKLTQGAAPLSIPHEGRIRPRIVVIAEAWGRTHAMYRCYREYIRVLREIGDLYLMATQETLDRSDLSDFDGYLVASHTDSKSNNRVLINLQPDAIYFPSLGMSFWSIVLATARIAPYQFATAGHPSFPYLQTVDEFFLPEVMLPISSLQAESSVVSMEGRERFHLLAQARLLHSDTKKTNKVSITAMVAKLSPEFICQLKKLKEVYPDIQYHFHIADQRISLSRLVDHLHERFPDAIIDGYLSYEDYLRRLSTSTLSITPTPFGHTNSLIDAVATNVVPLTVIHDNISSKAAHVVFGTRCSDQIITFDRWDDLFQKVGEYLHSTSKRETALCYAKQAVDSWVNADLSTLEFKNRIVKRLHDEKF